MKTFIVRPYFGYDCSSDMGFNNGNPLPEERVEAETPEAAIEAVMKLYAENGDWHMERCEVDGDFGESTFYWEFGHTDNEGNDMTQEEYNEADDDQRGGYLYRYIDFSHVEEDTATEG